MQDKLLSFEIHDLYGLYTHKIVLDSEESIKIVHGPNGVGKTALLRSIHSLFACDFDSLSKIPFSHIVAILSNGNEIQVKRVGVSAEQLLRRSKNVNHKIEVELKRDKKQVALHVFLDENTSVGRIPPWINRIAPGVWFDERSGEEVPLEVLDMYARNYKPKDKKNIEAITSTLQKIKVHFVETNRLYRQPQVQSNWKASKEPQLISSVRDCAKQITSHISTALKDYGKKSQELDQSFPHRFIYEPANPMALDELKVRLYELTQQLKNLRALGILDTEGNQPFDTEGLDTVEPYKLEIMNLYVRDSEKKLAVFDFLSSRVELLLGSLSEKFKNKRILLSKEKGLIAEGPKNLDIDLESLSSGEQHEIVLLYELLFKVSKDTLVLIDEPELSLHVTWQKAFLPELISIAGEVGFFSILATHSPYIVGDRYDLMTALDSEGSDDSLE